MPGRKTHKEVLKESMDLLNVRGLEYGDAKQTHKRIAEIASAIIGKELTSYDVAVLHMATKLARIRESPNKYDSYVDLINYTAFAAEFADGPDKEKT